MEYHRTIVQLLFGACATLIFGGMYGLMLVL